MVRSRPEDAVRVEAQRVVDRRRQLADLDATGLGQIAFANGAVERPCCAPDAEHEVELLVGGLFQLRCYRTRPVLQCGDGFVPSHTLDTGEPIDAIAALAAAVA